MAQDEYVNMPRHEVRELLAVWQERERDAKQQVKLLKSLIAKSLCPFKVGDIIQHKHEARRDGNYIVENVTYSAGKLGWKVFARWIQDDGTKLDYYRTIAGAKLWHKVNK